MFFEAADWLWLVFALGVVAIVYGVIRVLPALREKLARAKQVSECGFLSPPPTDAAHRQMVNFADWWVRHFVGKMELSGHEKLATLPGPFLLAFNHGSLLDVAIAPVVLNRKARFPAAQGVMKAGFGLVGLLFSKWGVFSVDLDNGHAAFDASVKALTSGDGSDIEVIFPEAWTNMDGKIGKMKTGTVRMAVAAAAKLGKPVYIVPGHMKYGRYLATWMTKMPIPVQWLIPLLGAFYYKRGVKVVIGEPISSADLHSDPKVATEQLRQTIIALEPR